MSKIDPLARIVSGYAGATLLDANSTKIEDALENTLSLDGSTPNSMGADFDMNGHQILNLPEAVDPTDPLLYGQAEPFLVAAEGFADDAAASAADAQDSEDAAAASASDAEDTLAEVIAAGIVAVDNIEDQEADSITAVQAQQTTSVAAVVTQQNTSTTAVAAQGTTSIAAVAAQGVTSAGLVTAEGTTQVAAVIAAGSALTTSATTTIPSVLAHLGVDLSANTTETVGVTTPNTTTGTNGFTYGNLAASSSGGLLSQVRLRLSATGTGELHIVEIATQTVVKVMPVTISSTTPTLVANVDFPWYYLPRGCSVFYKKLTGGHIRLTSGSTGRYFADSDYSGTPGDTVTLVVAGAAIAVAFDVIEAPASLEVRLSQLATRGPRDMYTTGMLAQYLFDSRSGTTEQNAYNPGLYDINLATPTNPNYTRIAKGMQIKAGLIQTPSLPGIRTVAQLVWCDPDSATAFLLSGGVAPTSGVYTTPGSGGVLTGETIHIGGGEGVHELFFKTDDGTAAYEISDGAWKIIFREMATTNTSIFGFGGRHSHASADRANNMMIRWAGFWTGQLDAAARTQVAASVSQWAAQFGIYIFNVDCPEQADAVLIVGDSSAQGKGPLNEASFVGTATFTTGGLGGFVIGSHTITVTAVTSGYLIPHMTLVGGNVQPGTKVVTAPTLGGTGTVTMDQRALSAGVSQALTGTLLDADFRHTFIAASDGSTTFYAFDKLRLGENQNPGFPGDGGPEVGWAMSRKSANATRRRDLYIMKFAKGSTRLAVADAHGVSDPLPVFTYNVNAARNTGLFGKVLRQYYTSTGEARSRGIGVRFVGWQISIGLQDATHIDYTGGSIAAYQGYYQGIHDALKLYTGATTLKAHVCQSHSGGGSDATALGHVRGGQAAFVTANSTEATLYDTDINYPSAGIYGGSPYGLEPDTHIKLFGTIKMGQAGYTAFGLT